MAADKWMQERAEELVGAYTGNLPALLLRAMEEQRERDETLCAKYCCDQHCKTAASIRRGGE